MRPDLTKLRNRILHVNCVTKAQAIDWHESRIFFADLMAQTPQDAKSYGQLAGVRMHSMNWLCKNRHVVRPEDLQ